MGAQMAPVLVLAMLAPTEGPVVVHRAPGRFAEIFVVDEGDARSLRFDWERGDDQTVIRKGHPEHLAMKYLQGAMVGFAAVPESRRFLMIGLGGGALTSYLAVTRPELVMDAVEIDPAVVAVAKAYFGVEEGPKLTIHVEDGARYVANTEHRYDVIFVDAYGSDDIPRHLTARRFFRALASRLTPTGVLVLNIAVDSMHVEQTLLATVSRVFRHCAHFTVEEDENTIVIAGAAPLPRDLTKRTEAIAKTGHLDAQLAKTAARRRPCPRPAP